MNDKHNCFDGVKGNLGKLPDKYKYWKFTLDEYRETFSFLKDMEIREACSEQRMYLDYQLSLFLWLEPKAVFGDLHFLGLCQTAGFICEALLSDLLKFKTADQGSEFAKEFLHNITKKMMFGLLIENLRGILRKKHVEYLDDIKNIRNSIHIKDSSKSITIAKERYSIELGIEGELFEKIKTYAKTPTEVTRELDEFIEDFKEYYN